MGQPNAGDCPPYTPLRVMSVEQTARELVLTVTVPGDQPLAEVVEALKEFVRKADALHRALGGHGLQVSDVKAFVCEEADHAHD